MMNSEIRARYEAARPRMTYAEIKALLDASATGGRWTVRMTGCGADLIFRWRFPTESSAAEAARMLKAEARDFFMGFTLSAHEAARRSAAR